MKVMEEFNDKILPNSSMKSNIIEPSSTEFNSTLLKKVPKHKKNSKSNFKANLCLIINLILLLTIALTFGILTVIFYTTVQSIQRELKYLTNLTAEMKSEIVDLKVEMFKVRQDIKKIRSRNWTYTSESDGDCLTLDYSLIDKALEMGSDEERNKGFMQLKYFHENPCFQNDSVFLVRLAGTYICISYKAGEDLSNAGIQLRLKYLTDANNTINQALLFNRNLSVIFKW